MNQDIREELDLRLKAAFAPLHLAIEDQSGRHKGHAGSSGGGHYAVTLVSALFDGKSMLEQHRMVYAELADLIPARVHALALNTLTPAQWSAAASTR